MPWAARVFNVPSHEYPDTGARMVAKELYADGVTKKELQHTYIFMMLDTRHLCDDHRIFISEILY